MLPEPHDISAERNLLGILLYYGEMGNVEIERVFEKISSFKPLFDFEKYFYNDVHQAIYRLIYANFANHVAISIHTLSIPLSREYFFQNDINMAKFRLEQIKLESGLPHQTKELVEKIIDLSMKRKILKLLSETSESITINKDAYKFRFYIDSVEKELAAMVTGSEPGEKECELAKHVAREILVRTKVRKENGCEFHGLKTGFAKLDDLLGGFQNSDLIILAARPSMGKTSLALCLAMNVAEHLRRKNDIGSVGFISLEMSADQLVTRLISFKSTVKYKDILFGNVDDRELELIEVASSNIETLNILIDDNAAMTIENLKRKCRKYAITYDLKILFVDYLQLLTGGKQSSYSNRVNEVSEISRGLKAIAKELNIPVIALSQLSRDLEKREDKTPRLSDLRESGSIEQDADIVMFLHREEYYLRMKTQQNIRKIQEIDSTKKFYSNFLREDITDYYSEEDHIELDERCFDQVAGKAKLYIAKHRNGALGEIDMVFDSETSVFIDPSEYQ